MTFNPPNLRTIALIAVGFALKFVSGGLEIQGDAASDAGTRLFYHLSALLFLLAAFGCFAWALKTIFFGKRTPPPPASAPERRDSEPDAGAFDPDEALERYMRERPGTDDDTKPGDFGRKGL